MSFPREMLCIRRSQSIEGGGFVLSSPSCIEKQRPKEKTEKPRSAKVLLGFLGNFAMVLGSDENKVSHKHQRKRLRIRNNPIAVAI